MQPNPILRKLGLTADDRVVIIHTDDIGMCHASLATFAELADFGLISSNNDDALPASSLRLRPAAANIPRWTWAYT